MVPSPATVMRLRYFTRVGCRVVGPLLILVGFTLFDRLAEVMLGASSSSSLTSGLFASTGSTGSSSALGVGTFLIALIPACSMIVPGVALFFMSSRVSKWLVPMPSNRCPYCDYPLGAVEDDRCPECGLILGRIPAPPPPVPPPPPPRTPAAAPHRAPSATKASADA